MDNAWLRVMNLLEKLRERETKWMKNWKSPKYSEFSDEEEETQFYINPNSVHM